MRLHRWLVLIALIVGLAAITGYTLVFSSPAPAASTAQVAADPNPEGFKQLAAPPSDFLSGMLRLPDPAQLGQRSATRCCPCAWPPRRRVKPAASGRLTCRWTRPANCNGCCWPRPAAIGRCASLHPTRRRCRSTGKPCPPACAGQRLPWAWASSPTPPRCLASTRPSQPACGGSRSAASSRWRSLAPPRASWSSAAPAPIACTATSIAWAWWRASRATWWPISTTRRPTPRREHAPAPLAVTIQSAEASILPRRRWPRIEPTRHQPGAGCGRRRRAARRAPGPPGRQPHPASHRARDHAGGTALRAHQRAPFCRGGAQPGAGRAGPGRAAGRRAAARRSGGDGRRGAGRARCRPRPRCGARPRTAARRRWPGSAGWRTPVADADRDAGVPGVGRPLDCPGPGASAVRAAQRAPARPQPARAAVGGGAHTAGGDSAAGLGARAGGCAHAGDADGSASRLAGGCGPAAGQPIDLRQPKPPADVGAWLLLQRRVAAGAGERQFHHQFAQVPGPGPEPLPRPVCPVDPQLWPGKRQELRHRGAQPGRRGLAASLQKLLERVGLGGLRRGRRHAADPVGGHALSGDGAGRQSGLARHDLWHRLRQQHRPDLRRRGGLAIHRTQRGAQQGLLLLHRRKLDLAVELVHRRGYPAG